MAKSYPPDLIEKVTAFVSAGNSRREAARHFGVSASFVVKLMQKAAAKSGGGGKKQAPAAVEAAPDLATIVVSSSDLAEMFGVSRRSVSEFSERGIIDRVGRNRFALQRSVKLYCEHMRGVAAGRGGDGTQELTAERARLAREQADGTALKNAVFRRDLVPTHQVEREWVTVCRKIRNAVLAVPSRVRQTLPHLTSFDVEQISRELRLALTDLGKDDSSIAIAEEGGVGEPAAASETQTVGVD
jgi:phage terminase Nu1 subunit (DNA packaging protein)